MTSALRQASVPDYRFCGVHVCICGAVSDSTNRFLANGAVTTWEFGGTYADGKPLGLGPAVVALPTPYNWNQAI